MAAAESSSAVPAASSNTAEAAKSVAKEQNELYERLAAALTLVVFDFDLTVLKVHSYAARIKPEDVEKRDWKSDFEDLELFKSVCKNLKERGVHVAVASFGMREVITRYLELAFEGSFRTIFPEACISTPASVGEVDGCANPEGKNPQIQLIRKTLGIDSAPAKSVLLFEDDYRNCQLAHKAGYVAFHCPKHFMRAAWDIASAGYVKSFAPSVAGTK